MRRFVPIALIATALLLAACGDDESTTTTVTETSAGTTVSEDTTSTPAPSGELTPDGVGEATRGSTEGEVATLFGQPEEKQEGPGCELSAESKRSTAWIYAMSDGGRLALTFDSATQELGAYRSSSADLQTERGDTVGDTFDTLLANWGDSLAPLDLGVPATPKAGIWQVEDGDEGLLFDIRGGKIAAISGGHIEICE